MIFKVDDGDSFIAFHKGQLAVRGEFKLSQEATFIVLRDIFDHIGGTLIEELEEEA